MAAMPPNLPGRRIESCPVCEYSWEGLPEEGACPECGLRFLPETCEYPLSVSTGTAVYAAVLATVAWLGVMSLMMTAEELHGWRLWLIMLPVSAVGCICAWRLFLIIRLTGRGQVMILLADGLFIKSTGHHRGRLITWDEIESIRVIKGPKLVRAQVRFRRFMEPPLRLNGPYGRLDPFMNLAEQQRRAHGS